MLNFDKTAQDVITTQVSSSRSSQFTDFWSKKKLFEAKVLTEAQEKFFNELKRTFAFSLHTSKKYMVVTLYRKGEKGSDFLVVDMDSLRCAEAPSVKIAKEGVLELIKSAASAEPATVQKPAETAENPAETAPETAPEVQPEAPAEKAQPEAPASRKNHNK